MMRNGVTADNAGCVGGVMMELCELYDLKTSDVVIVLERLCKWYEI